MASVIALWFLVVMLSPLIVLIGKDSYTVTGWLAIGNYDFDIYDGLFRSLCYFVATTPIILAVYLGRPKTLNERNRQIINFRLMNRIRIGNASIFLMMLFCLVSFRFNLGITGVETDTGGWRLSGLVHYIRSYLFLILIGVYIFGEKSPSGALILTYSFVAGITSGSRFVAVAPLVLLLTRGLIHNDNRALLFKNTMLLIWIFVLFSFITFFRNILYDDRYSFDNIFIIVSNIDLREAGFIYDGFSQIALRLGIGRDVILSNEVSAASVCTDAMGLFFGAGSCPNPALDFYGVELGDGRFGLSPPMLSSLFVITDSIALKMVFSFCYALVAYFLCISVRFANRLPFGSLIVHPLYIFMVVFLLIGPISFAWVLTMCLVIASLLSALLSGACSAQRLN